MESIQAMKLSKINHNLQDITKSNKSTKRKSSKFVEVCKFMFKIYFPNFCFSNFFILFRKHSPIYL